MALNCEMKKKESVFDNLILLSNKTFYFKAHLNFKIQSLKKQKLFIRYFVKIQSVTYYLNGP